MTQSPMQTNWAEKIAERLLGAGVAQPGVCLILGGVDTGKTTLAAALAGHLTPSGPAGVIDADIGQSHIGPPATVGWAIVEKEEMNFSQLAPGGISFVGDITPVGHLLQLTAAIAQSVRQVSKVTQRIIIDTPGFISGPAASALWWTVRRIVQPKLIVAIQRNNELTEILAGLRNLGSPVELLDAPPGIPVKSPEARRRYRHSRFRKYFQDSRVHTFELSKTTIQATRKGTSDQLRHRLVALRDGEGIDRALGLIEDWQPGADKAVVKAPLLDVAQIRCLVMGDVTVDLAGE